MPPKKRKAAKSRKSRAGKNRAGKSKRKAIPERAKLKQKQKAPKVYLAKPEFRKAPAKLNNVILMILDGWGVRTSKKYNAVKLAKTPNMNLLAKYYPSTKINASSTAVGLPKGQMGNSEVGHMTIGAGRVVEQELVIISKAIRNGSFFKNKAIIEAFKKGDKVHIMGLVSDGGVHSHIEHLFVLLKMAKKYKKYVCVHAFLDGRDTPNKSAEKYLKQLEKKLKGIGEISTIMGRYYAMDRDHRWERTEKAYNCIALGSGIYSKGLFDGLDEAYRRGETDEFVSPTLASLSYKGVQDGDSVIFFNFREDRARQLTKAFVNESFMEFRREKKDVSFLTMVQYEEGIKADVAFMQSRVENTLGEVVSKARMKQLRIAETEKYAHVTFFMSCMREELFKGEDRVLIPSPKVATYDLKPEMSAFEIKDEAIKRIRAKEYALIILNFANGDMVGHSGILDAAIKGCEAVDSCIGEIAKEMLATGGAAIIIGDHGNCEEMFGKHATTHTTNPVPFILVSNYKYRIKKKGALYNVAPTILKLLGLKKPKEMEREMI